MKILKHKHFVDMPQLQTPMVRYGRLKHDFYEGTQDDWVESCKEVTPKDLLIAHHHCKNNKDKRVFAEFQVILQGLKNAHQTRLLNDYKSLLNNEAPGTWQKIKRFFTQEGV